MDPSFETYNLDHDEMEGGEKLEMIAVLRKAFREFLCSSNIRTNLEPESDRKNVDRIVCFKLRDDLRNPGELTR